MKLSTKGRYGVRLMFDLATHYGNGPIFLKDIAERQGISEKYLWQLIPPLKQAGLVTSTRGAHGGYELSKSPDQMTVREIVSAVEGPLNLVDCVGDPSICARKDACVVNGVWSEISAKLIHVMDGITLASMVEKQQEQDVLNYVI